MSFNGLKIFGKVVKFITRVIEYYTKIAAVEETLVKVKIAKAIFLGNPVSHHYLLWQRYHLIYTREMQRRLQIL